MKFSNKLMRAFAVVAVILTATGLTLVLGLSTEKLTNESVVKMLRSGLSEAVILGVIESQPGDYTLTPEALISLKEAGVTDKIIEAMVKATRRHGNITVDEQTNHKQVIIPDATEVKLKLLEPLSSASSRVGDPVKLEVVEDVVVNGVTVIQKGAPARGEVTEARPKKSFGRSGKLNFVIQSVRAANGQNIRLRFSREHKGEDSYGAAGVVTLLAGPFGALIKGKDIEIPAGKEFTVYVDGDKELQF